MFNFFRRKPKQETPPPEFTEAQFNTHYKHKKQALERILGPMHDHVFHAIVPFNVGGAVDLYCFTEGIPGTAFVTMELIQPDGTGPKPTRRGTYELISFTRFRPLQNKAKEKDSPYEIMAQRFFSTLTDVAWYALSAELGPGETCEVPWKEGEPNRCLILDAYADGFTIGPARHCLLLCLEIHREEMEFARANGGDKLLARLKERGVYPYSDLDRVAVV